MYYPCIATLMNSWHFLGGIFSPFLSNAFSKSSNFDMWDCFESVNSNRSSIIASQYFLFSRQLRIVLIYDCQIVGETFSPIGILWYKYEPLPKYGNIPQYFFECSDNLREWNASFKSSIKSTSYLELPNAENVFFINV